MFKRLMVLILLLAALSVTAPAAQAQLITAVAHRNTDADATEDPQIAPNPLDEGALTFVDRTHIYADVPEFIIGAEYIMLANDNKNMSAYEVDITLAKSAIVYVFVDNRMGGAAGGLGVDPIITGMPWLTDMGFVDIGEDIGIDESADGSINQYFSIFALEVKAGVVTIGGCTEGHSGNMLGAAVLPAPTSETATNPVPADAATDVVREIVLQWTPGETAVTHDVYLGTVFDDVNTASRANPLGVLVSQGQSDASYDPDGLLEFGTTYYWRIDEVNAPPDSTIFKGEVWSFTTEPFAYPITGIIATSNAVSNAGVGPERTIDGSGLDAADGHSTDASDMWLGLPAGDDPVYIQYEFDKVYKLYEMWVWNYNVQFEPVLGFGLKNVTIEYSADGADWTALGDAELARASAQAGYAHNSVVDLQGVAARSVRLTVNSNWGMLAQYGLSEVRFFYVPVQAREPQPADAATSIDPDTVLSWRAGREATSHEVYFGTRPEELLLVDTVDQSSSTPGELDLGATYYWRVDEIGEETWVGEVWSFSTLEYVMVDGFEDYNDDLEAGTTIFDTWLDGWVNETGSTVGYLNAPFAERTIVHSGVQSMPLQY
ncbi:MAG: hypothetical protein GXY33_22945, partial [Phycisphaerae bacterium]|nr:hypothetical protein [Phycisphaerae bacterium]